jgi:hypothetical protein
VSKEGARRKYVYGLAKIELGDKGFSNPSRETGYHLWKNQASMSLPPQLRAISGNNRKSTLLRIDDT